jgi:hypothetical protein
MEEKVQELFVPLHGADSSRMSRFRFYHPDGRTWMSEHGERTTWEPTKDQSLSRPIPEQSDK